MRFTKLKWLAAICAAPSVLASLGLLDGKPATCHPAFEAKMGKALLTHESVAVADNIITGQGLGAGIPFALALVKTLVDEKTNTDVGGGSSDHTIGFHAESDDLARFPFHRDNRRLTENDAVPLHIDHDIGSSEVNSDIPALRHTATPYKSF